MHTDKVVPHMKVHIMKVHKGSGGNAPYILNLNQFNVQATRSPMRKVSTT